MIPNLEDTDYFEPPCRACAEKDAEIVKLGEALHSAECCIASMEAKINVLIKDSQRLHWLHENPGKVDRFGGECGIYIIMWRNGKVVKVEPTLSDFSDLDAEMEREKRGEKGG